MPVDPRSVPDFDDLPKVQGMRRSWGLFDKDGEKDLIGTLNFITPEAVKAIGSKVKDGVSISLNLPLNAMEKLDAIGRKKSKHTISFIPETMGYPERMKSWDDEVEFNTQASSQWDSLCHVNHFGSGLAYNGFDLNKKDLADPIFQTKFPTIEHWHSHGGIVARGVLLDYKAFAEETKVPFSAFGNNPIKVKDLEACAKHFGVEFCPGDILIVRIGMTEVVNDPTEEDKKQMKSGIMNGLDGCEETARWLWNKRFAAVASDGFGLELFPTRKDEMPKLSTYVENHSSKWQILIF
ncbi:hypothetical protein CDD81_6805 [Ophiocordyceps australis]|uniref:Cyclase n=1 Tax=Ophiocordyceps australis TaxID=1399860 RepID=A0A2C5X998_9HYPO|nr:hypothetical protein CDD81_6805 [Ophiocordyceps australis]